MLRTLTRRTVLSTCGRTKNRYWTYSDTTLYSSQCSQLTLRTYTSKSNAGDGKYNGGAKGKVGIKLFGIPILLWGAYLFAPEWNPFESPKASPFRAPKFTAFTIIGREDVSPETFIITVRPGLGEKATNRYMKKADLYEDEWKKGTWAVEFKQPQLQIARSYTPLPPLLSRQNLKESIYRTDEDSSGDLRFLIKKEPGGEVSNYLASLPVGAKVELRGPHRGVELPSHITDVVFLAGGTGIAPAMQVIYNLLQANHTEGAKSPHISVVWANRKRDSCVGGGISSKFIGKPGASKPATLVQELEWMKLRFPDNLTVQYLVDEESDNVDQKRISTLIKNNTPIKSGPITTRIDSRLIFVSGPEGFVDYVAGPKKWLNGKETQGEIGGLLSRLSLKEWKVWKH